MDPFPRYSFLPWCPVANKVLYPGSRQVSSDLCCLASHSHQPRVWPDLGPGEEGAAGENFIEVWSGTLLLVVAEGPAGCREGVCEFAHFVCMLCILASLTAEISNL